MPRQLNPEGLNEYLAYGYVTRANCILSGYAKLPAGHQLEYKQDTGKFEVTPYWTLPLAADGQSGSIEERADELEALLQESVKYQLEADVPVGVLLSGGVDSSLVTAMAARVSSN